MRFRRAVTLLLMTLVLPGSAQLVAGHRTVGRIALRVWVALLGTLMLVLLLSLAWSGVAFWLASNTVVLALVRAVLFVAALGWAALFVDAWRLGQPLELRQKQRLAVVGLNAALCFSVAGTLLFTSHVVGVQREFIATMFGDGVASEADDGRYNVLLVGGDSGADRWGLRADSLTLASIDEDTGRTVLFGLPRNLQDFPFAEDSVMAEQFPDGFDCEGCYLNSLSTWTADHKELFADVAEPGMAATISGVEGVTGLDVHYYAMVNLKGFRQLVDAVGGVEMHVRDRIPIGGGDGSIAGYIEPGTQRLDGFETLWFARSRATSDDYSRMARQKCVMNAMLQQLSPRTVLTQFEQIAEASQELVSTNLPASELDTFLDLALKARTQPVRTVSFVPPLVNTAEPDVAAIQERVQQAIDGPSQDASDDGRTVEVREPVGDAPAGAEAGGGGAAGAPAATGGAIGSISEGYAANQSGDLRRTC